MKTIIEQNEDLIRGVENLYYPCATDEPIDLNKEILVSYDVFHININGGNPEYFTRLGLGRVYKSGGEVSDDATIYYFFKRIKPSVFKPPRL